MRLFLTILEGRTPGEAEPILATEDGRLIELVCCWIEERLRPAFLRHDRGPKLGCAEDGKPDAPTSLCFHAVHDFSSGTPAEQGGGR